ncbi:MULTISPECIES: SH3 domain-containing protein [unclassified Leptolyngbya]|uniref:SH3 domain-containing protein n=1 Tax=unclassified Leptolyngbya TaxID=2650499 RepID=UPI0016856F2D|nr:MULTISPECIES: SH3 domain-containing protein [unclassified Leptolyngbya]MBD1912929.1 SH3 domain-containing protein [Leptolyngbya sp. FACHB-8]MBD2154742.1 SH3 domain-containing protein [Leptolyngbya sp. FACHB-16]
MESLAYIHNAVAYESNDPVPELRPLLADWEIPSSAWIATSTLVITLLVTGVQQEAIAAVTGVVQTGGATLNVRKAPDGPIVGTLPNGSTLQLTGRARDGWLERADGTWVMAQYVQPPMDQAAAPKSGSPQAAPQGNTAQRTTPAGGTAQAAPQSGNTFVAYARTNGAPLNVRSSPNGGVISTVPNGGELRLTGRSSNGWLERTDGTWVAARFVHDTPPGRTAATTPKNDTAVATNPSPSAAQGGSTRVGYVSTGGNPLNFRKSPGGEVAGRLANGTQVELTGREQNGFLERTDGTWVQAQYIQFTPPASPSPAPAASASPSPAAPASPAPAAPASPAPAASASPSPAAPASPAPAASASPSPAAPASPSPAASASPRSAPATAQSPRPAAPPAPAARTSAAPAAAPSPASASQATVRTNGTPLNVRSSPGGAIVGSLPNGSVIELSGRQSGSWTQRSNGTWVASQFIGPQSSGSDASVAFVRTNGSPLNVRSSPDGAVVGTLPNGAQVELTGRRSGEWAQRTNSTWISSNWLSTSGSGGSSGGSSGGGTGSDASTAFVRTNGTPLNVRSSPGGAVIGTLPNGSQIELSGRRSGEWVQRTNGTWISGTWISTSGGGTTPPPDQGGDASTAFVSTNGTPLNVRSSPGGAVIGTLPSGSRVELSGRRSGEWVQRTNGTWISANWISTSGGSDGGVGGPDATAVVTTNGNPLLVRSSPGGSVIGEYANGTRITLNGRTSGNWVQLNNGGWVSGDWVSRL